MQIVSEKITVNELKKMSEKMFGGYVKAVVDLEKEIMVVDAELHSDQEALLLENESKQGDLWGINLYPDNFGNDNFFDSMINLRPSWGNKTRDVDDLAVRENITNLVHKLVIK